MKRDSRGLAPAMNETASTFNNSNAGQQVRNSLNKYWAYFVNYWAASNENTVH